MDMQNAQTVEHNPIGDMTAERFLGHYRRIAEARREARAASAEASAGRKAAKSDGVDPDAHKWAQAMVDANLTPDECRAKLVACLHYLVWLNFMPKGTQLSMIDAPQVPKQTRAKQEAWAAGEAGLKAGRDGEPASTNPHKPGTEPHQTYAQQYKRGLEERATAARMMDDHEDSRPADVAQATKRGRRGGTALERARAHLEGGSTSLPN